MSEPTVERLGILGGTFDPVHNGHLGAALEARHQLQLDRVLVVVAGDPWQKEGDVVASAADRYAMVVGALDGIAGVEPSRIEIERPGSTYTADTLRELARPGRELVLILGSDVAARLHTWERVDEVRALATLAIVARGDDPVEVPVRGWRFETVRMPRLDISSTDLRARIVDGRPIEHLVPAGAVRVLREHRPYTPGDVAAP